MRFKAWHKVVIFVGALIVIGAVTGGALYYAYPVQVSILAALTRNYIVTLSAPAGTTTTEVNPAYKAATGVQPASAVSSSGTDWPSYNKTLTSERFSPLSPTTLAISSGRAMRRSGIAASSCASFFGSFIVARLIGVATAPGATPTTRMLCLASSTPAVRVSMRMPPLERQ